LIAEPLKNFYTSIFLTQVSGLIAGEWQSFPVDKFLAHFSGKPWNDAELKARVRIISTALHACLPQEYKKRLTSLFPRVKK